MTASLTVPMIILFAGMILGVLAWVIIDAPTWIDGLRQKVSRDE